MRLDLAQPSSDLDGMRSRYANVASAAGSDFSAQQQQDKKDSKKQDKKDNKKKAGPAGKSAPKAVRLQKTTPKVAKQPKADRKVVRQPKASRKVAKQPKATRRLVSQPKATRKLVKQPKATRHAVRQQKATRETTRRKATSPAARRIVTPQGTKAVTASRLRGVPARGAGRAVIRGHNYSAWRSGYRVRHGNGWRTFVALSALSAILVGSNEYYPYAYISAPQPYCEGFTEDG